MKTAIRWHSTREADRAVFHNHTRCREGAAIELKYRRPGAGGRAACAHCARYARQERRGPPSVVAMAVRGPALPETDEPRCPYCRSYRIAPLGCLIIALDLFKEAHRCEGCHTTFAVVGPAMA